MKKRKILPVFLAAALTASILSGCSSVTVGPDLVGEGTLYKDVAGLTEMEGKKAEAVKNAFMKKFSKAKINTMEADMKVVADLSISDSGITMGVKADLEDTLRADMENEIMNQKIEGEMEILGMSMDLSVDAYTLKEGKKFVSYAKTSAMGEEGEWEKSEAEKDISDFSFTDDIEADTIKTVYQNPETGSYVFEIEPKAMESMTAFVEDSIGNAADYSFDFSKVKAYMTLDKKIGIIGYYIDLKDGMDVSSEESVSVDQLDIEFTYLSLNDELDISLPKEAKNAKEEPVETQSPFHPIGETDPETKPVSETETEAETPAILETIPETEAEETLPERTDGSANEDIQLDTSKYSHTNISINGKTINIPCSISSLESAGLVPEPSEMVEGGSFEILFMETGKDDMVMVTVDNPTNEPLSASSCLVTEISHDAFLADSAIDFSVFGVQNGMSISEIEAILGKPVYTYTGSDGYMSNDYSHEGCEITITYHNDIATGIDVSV